MLSWQGVRAAKFPSVLLRRGVSSAPVRYPLMPGVSVTTMFMTLGFGVSFIKPIGQSCSALRSLSLLTVGCHGAGSNEIQSTTRGGLGGVFRVWLLGSFVFIWLGFRGGLGHWGGLEALRAQKQSSTAASGNIRDLVVNRTPLGHRRFCTVNLVPMRMRSMLLFRYDDLVFSLGVKGLGCRVTSSPAYEVL